MISLKLLFSELLSTSLSSISFSTQTGTHFFQCWWRTWHRSNIFWKDHSCKLLVVLQLSQPLATFLSTFHPQLHLLLESSFLFEENGGLLLLLWKFQMPNRLPILVVFLHLPTFGIVLSAGNLSDLLELRFINRINTCSKKTIFNVFHCHTFVLPSPALICIEKTASIITDEAKAHRKKQ